jgi:hypothetical protein
MKGSATTPVEILNRALGHLGLEPVNFFDPSTGELPSPKPAVAVARMYAPTIDEVQRAFDWQELMTATELKALDVLETQSGEEVTTAKDQPIGLRTSTEKDYEGRWIFDLDGLEVIKVQGIRLPQNLAVGGAETVLTMSFRGESLQLYDYEIVGNTLRAYLPNLYLLYNRRISDVSAWSSELEDCISMKLAINAGVAAAGDWKVVDYLRKIYLTEVFPTAKRQQSRSKQGVQYMPWNGPYPLNQRSGGWTVN